MEKNKNAIRKNDVQVTPDPQEVTQAVPSDGQEGNGIEIKEEKKDGTFPITKNAASVLKQAKMLPYCQKANGVDETGVLLERNACLHGPVEMMASEYFKTSDMAAIDRAIEDSPFFRYSKVVVLTVPNDGQSHDRGRVLRAACYVARCWEDLHEPTLEDYFDMEMDEDIQDTDDDEYMDGQEPVAEDDEFTDGPESAEDETESDSLESGCAFMGLPSGFEIYDGNDTREYYRLVDLESSPETGGNPYVALISSEGPDRIQIMTGFSDGTDLALKIDAAKADHNKFKVVVLNEKLMSHPAVLDFLAGWRNVALHLEAEDGDDDLRMFRFLLSESDYCDTPDEVLKNALSRLKKAYGSRFDTEHIVRHCYEAVTKADREKAGVLTAEMFIKEREKHGVMVELNTMTGLQNVKRTVEDFAALVMEEKRNPKIHDTHRHMIFTGNPGSGKTTVARKLADLLAECGIGNGVFIEADRSSLIGKYVGHTAPLVKKCFDEARGGVLFVDEAGFFLDDNDQGFNGEAIKEFVRYMENYPDVTVIFAMYKKELEEFLKLDQGLSSRISRVIEFEDYTEVQLQEIVLKMLADKGYCITEADGADRILEYIKANRKDLDNGRGARQFTEAIIQEHSLDLFRNQDRVESHHLRISNEDISRAAVRMKERASAGRLGKRAAGFALSSCISERRAV